MDYPTEHCPACKRTCGQCAMETRKGDRRCEECWMVADEQGTFRRLVNAAIDALEASR